MGKVTININIHNLSQIQEGLRKSPALMVKNLNIAIRKTIFLIEEKSTRNAPVKSGYLRNNVHRNFKPLYGEFGYKAKYAVWVHDGTSPYTIYPRTKMALFWKGAAHPVKRVNHPGIRANPFLRRAVETNQHTVDKIFTQAVDDTFNEIVRGAK